MGVNVQQIYYNYKVSYVQKKWRSVHIIGKIRFALLSIMRVVGLNECEI